MSDKKTWFITGSSSGLGLIIVKQLLATGQNVVATTRNIDSLDKTIGKTSNFLPVSMDVNDESSVKAAVGIALSHFGAIDVVVNNAGFGQTGTLEELQDSEVRRSFDVNVFGMLNVIREVMPHLRARGNGHIINISSMAGIQGYIPGWGIYCAAKFAVAGLSEALAAEVKPFGIKVTLVYPGHMRTGFLSKGSLMLPSHPVSDYVLVRENEKEAAEDMNGQQMGDPQKAAAKLIKISQLENPPLHYFLGEDVYDAARKKIQTLSDALETWKDDSLSIGF
ncbi:SDR family NAD(P)-dependent oxidoreductase [Pantoea sp. Bo_2]|uniref:SDR family NAD(P)-dependent oxidoreductase n=1 Tax=Candidatus Pantoea gossypiicola TaxID=2608008 RepID=A0AB34CG25_9GAMM|nr:MULTISPECIES: SDR family NAD(P)-dependent oxidoreductase [Pantoea]KAA5927806.1 SDR family NAD(P)-dependent oxidoreductase [Pantoea sp. VH_8]KAA5932536.1 SDR family NAD(P)-dependent oxidoreductase [Pantoea sp. VH_4]KAA5939272.1 SDR family NAD(P)-dependent oxidoreductase [Pantoea sp. VH_3]KAA5948150.1 SDR family NAD(P)-dependent oxidoreductase [Pantoea sp. VH_25]KAA5957126.1 SDR family NAD(P)-dependent oxidoreductase [Pantoea sp. VH_16]